MSTHRSNGTIPEMQKDSSSCSQREKNLSKRRFLCRHSSECTGSSQRILHSVFCIKPNNRMDRPHTGTVLRFSSPPSNIKLYWRIRNQIRFHQKSITKKIRRFRKRICDLYLEKLLNLMFLCFIRIRLFNPF